MKTLIFALLLCSSTAGSQTFQQFINRVITSPESERMAIVDSFLIAIPAAPFKENDTTVHFLFRGNVSTLTIAGDANNWSGTTHSMARLSTTDLWYRTFNYESDARLDYKFVANGSTWLLDPRNPFQVSGGFGPNSELRMPAYVPAPEILYYPGIPHGTLRDTSFYSAGLGNSRTVRIYTPPNYVGSSDSFAVILFHDGLEYVTLAQANNVLDYLIYHNRIAPTIAIFIPPVNRTSEYAGAQQNLFTSFIVNEIMPYMDARYRTRRNPAHRAVMGASNGGNIALWIGYNHPTVFGNIGAQSSNVQTSISAGFQSSPKLNLKLYLDLGTYDIPVLLPLVRNLVSIIQPNGYTYRYTEFHEGHSWGNWRAHIDDALEMFFPPTTVGVNETSLKPESFHLFQNYPNPFNPSTTITFSVFETQEVQLRVYDILGKEVATLLNEVKSPGSYSVRWNPGDMANGVYICRMSGNNQHLARQMLLLK